MATVRIRSQYKRHVITVRQTNFKEQTERPLSFSSNLREITDDRCGPATFCTLVNSTNSENS